MPRFVIHEHFAERAGHHYDLRLELDGVAKSWVLKKGLPNKGERRLAIQTFDHDLSYMDFEGEIVGYGKGIVKIYDKGEFEILSRTKDKIKFRLKGKKVEGVFVLVRFPKVRDGWIMVRS